MVYRQKFADHWTLLLTSNSKSIALFSHGKNFLAKQCLFSEGTVTLLQLLFKYRYLKNGAFRAENIESRTVSILFNLILA